MKNQSKNNPGPLTPFVHPFGNGYINFLIEQVENDGEVTFHYESAVYTSTDRNHLIEAIIRDKYSQFEVEAITQNFLADEDKGEFATFQRWRKLAKLVADGTYLKAEIENQLGVF